MRVAPHEIKLKRIDSAKPAYLNPTGEPAPHHLEQGRLDQLFEANHGSRRVARKPGDQLSVYGARYSGLTGY